MNEDLDGKTEPLVIATIILGVFVILAYGAFAVLVRAVTDSNHKTIAAVSEEKAIVQDNVNDSEDIISEVYPGGNPYYVDDKGNSIVIFTNADDLT